jgi:superfamily II DNA or RNA helicase
MPMSDSALSKSLKRAQLLKSYQKLTLVEQKIVQMLAVLYESTYVTVFARVFSEFAEQFNARDKAALGKNFKSKIDRLIELGLCKSLNSLIIQCELLIVDIAVRDAVTKGDFEKIVAHIEKSFPVPTYGNSRPNFKGEAQFVREVRIGIYRHDLNYVEQQYTYFYYYDRKVKPELSLESILFEIVNNPFDSGWFQSLPSDVYGRAMKCICIDSMLNLTPMPEAFKLLHESCLAGNESTTNSLLVLLIEQLMLRGRLTEAEQFLQRLPEGNSFTLLTGGISSLRGDYTQAIATYTVALKVFRKEVGKRNVFFSGIAGIFYILALIKAGTGDRLQEAENYASILVNTPNHWLQGCVQFLGAVIRFQRGDLSQKELVLGRKVPSYVEHHAIGSLISAVSLYWLNLDAAKKALPKIIESLHQQAIAAEMYWIARESSELLNKLKANKGKGFGDRGSQIPIDIAKELNLTPAIVEFIQPKENWEISLNALVNLNQPTSASPKSENNLRLAWFITLTNGNCTIQPKEQKQSAKGVWGNGRNIALKRLRDSLDEFSYLTVQDHQVCRQIEVIDDGYYGSKKYTFSDRAIRALVGHSLVFWEDSPGIPVEVVKGEPELLVKQKTNAYLTVGFFPETRENQEIVVVKETPTRIRIFEIKEEHRRIISIIGAKNQLEVPVSAKERVLAAISAISGVLTIQSDIGGGAINAEEVSADSTPHVHLLPAADGLKVAVLARPFSNAGSYYQPGSGGTMVMTEIEGRRLQTTRNLKEEKKLANAAIGACPTFGLYESADGEWQIEDPEHCLELLGELQELGDRVILEWPQGEKMRISSRADFGNFKMSINRSKDWFAAEGELKLDNQTIVDMQQLMALLAKTPSRFVPLGDGQFLALTQEFRKRLDELRSYAESHGKGVRFHPLAAIGLEDLVDQVGELKADKHWKAHLKRLKEMKEFKPEVPSTLQAELRDYQIEGFNWLSRLAYWGVGACLADDMGLGKTLQSLALILSQAPKGATMIIAPTSVCNNWVAEAEKFAPTLNVIQFGAIPTESRKQVLTDLQPLDMVVCSYGLLQQEEVAEMLAQVQWQVLVLDEAQAIKNFATKRSQAAMNLQAGFKLITTGTPVENHLGELWNLFRFINPGLLGSLDSFNQRFANPIERSQDKEARNQLRKLIQPFLLRRTKNQVLQELPSRTEITLQVELSREEIAFYEALRREAIAKLTEIDAPAGQKHLQVLAEIMKLRRACCSSRLVKPEIVLPSSKLQLFGEILTELLDNRHKALVFSQFVDHLKLIREYLDSQNITYQYLDGSTPMKERKKRVDAFQAGTGDVFLISLKAGGTGLNLTAADYVIHMDPWWNPSVEDQASDRAHRIGQLRPVTIYRLVGKNTIEEKIVQLHGQKRDLADSLLEGTDVSGKISTEALLNLLNQN